MRPLAIALLFIFFGFQTTTCLVNAETRYQGISLPVAISEEQIDQKIDELKALITEQPEDFILLAYLGHALTQKALFVPLSQKRALALKGTGTIDRAVLAAPADPRLRLIRAINSILLPKILNRHPIALRDFELLETQLQKSPETFSLTLTRQTLFYLGSFAQKEGEKGVAIQFLKKAQEIPSDIPSNQIIQSLLDYCKT